MRRDLITVAIPVYERFDYFINAVNSVLNQTLATEIIVVDNNSSHNKFAEFCSKQNITFFKNKMIDLMTIGGEVQDTIVYSNGKKVGLMDSLGRFNAFEKQDFNINKIAQAYSRHLNKQNTPFVFEGMEIPGSNAGSQIRTRENILYII